MNASHVLLDLDGLRAKGITYHKQHLRRLIRARKFPRPVKLVEGGQNGWVEAEIDAYIAAAIARRDAGERAAKTT
jgi:predicted DNA-binding transcriptional regulator AlpA